MKKLAYIIMLLATVATAQNTTPILFQTWTFTGTTNAIPITLTPAQYIQQDTGGFLVQGSPTIIVSPTNGIVQTNLANGIWSVGFIGVPATFSINITTGPTTNVINATNLLFNGSRFVTTSNLLTAINNNGPNILSGTNIYAWLTNGLWFINTTRTLNGFFVGDGSGLTNLPALSEVYNFSSQFSITNGTNIAISNDPTITNGVTITRTSLGNILNYVNTSSGNTFGINSAVSGIQFGTASGFIDFESDIAAGGIMVIDTDQNVTAAALTANTATTGGVVNTGTLTNSLAAGFASSVYVAGAATNAGGLIAAGITNTSNEQINGSLNVAGAPGLTVLPNGNVGIGKTNPPNDLYVVGTTEFNDSTNLPETGNIPIFYFLSNLHLTDNTANAAMASLWGDVIIDGTGSPLGTSHGVGTKGSAEYIGSGVLPQMVGTQGGVANNGTGKIGTVEAVQAQFAGNVSGGVITNLYGFYFLNGAQNNAGTINLMAGLYIPNNNGNYGTGTILTNYGIYIGDPTVSNKFAGKVNAGWYGGSYNGNNIYFENPLILTNGSTGSIGMLDAGGNRVIIAQMSGSSTNVTMGNSVNGSTTIQAAAGEIDFMTGQGAGTTLAQRISGTGLITFPFGVTASETLDVDGLLGIHFGMTIDNTDQIKFLDTGGNTQGKISLSSGTNVTFDNDGGNMTLSSQGVFVISGGTGGGFTNWFQQNPSGNGTFGGTYTFSNTITTYGGVSTLGTVTATNGSGGFSIYGADGTADKLVSLTSQSNALFVNNFTGNATYGTAGTGSTFIESGGTVRLTFNNNGSSTFATNVAFTGITTVNTNLVVTNIIGLTSAKLEIGTNHIECWNNGAKNFTVDTNGNIFANSLVVGAQTNVASGTIVNTNWVSGQLYTNFTGRPIQVTCNATLTAAAVTGYAQLALWIPGAVTNFATESTSATVITGATTNAIASGFIASLGTFSYTNTSIGAGNGAGTFSGQYIVY